MTRFFGAATVLCLWGLPLWAGAQSPGKVQVATVTASAQPNTVVRGGMGMLRVVVNVAPQFHINAHRPDDPDLIATTLDIGKTAGITFGATQFPAAQQLTVKGLKTPLAVYQGHTFISIPFTVVKTAGRGRVMLRAVLHYQGCTASACYPPMSVPVHAVVMVR